VTTPPAIRTETASATTWTSATATTPGGRRRRRRRLRRQRQLRRRRHHRRFGRRRRLRRRRQLCVGDDATGDADGDGICDDNDSCVGDDATGDSDEDGVCDDADLCRGDDATGDLDEDGICADNEVCWGDFDEDGYPNIFVPIVPADEMCDDPGEVDIDAPVPPDCNDEDARVYPTATELPGDGLDSNCDSQELCYVDLDHDSWGSDTTTSVDLGFLYKALGGSCDAPSWDLSARSGDCDDTNPFAYPGAFEVVANGVDESCDRTELCWLDNDDDGWLAFGEANNRAPRGMPRGLPVGPPPGTIVSVDLDCTDAREGGDTTPVGDCDDNNAAVYPNATEIPNNGVDEDCDQDDLGTTCGTDLDDDGWRTGELLLSADEDCDDPGEVSLIAPGVDCDDTNPNIYPGATELIGDGISQDCDATELCWIDADDDGWRPIGALPFGIPQAPPGTVISFDLDCEDPGEAPEGTPTGDCNDQDATINPAATDLPVDQIDQNCDGRDGGRFCFADADDDGWRVEAPVVSADDDCDDPGEAPPEDPAIDCDDTNAAIYPGAAEIPNDGIDQDCNQDDLGRTCYVDADGDTWRLDTTLVSADDDCDDPGEAWDDNPAFDCDDNDAATYPGAAEIPNDGIDQDCNQDDLGSACFADADNDGWRTDGLTQSADEDCDDLGEATPEDPALDCDDTNAAIYPGAAEIPNDGIDQDCNQDDLGRICYVDADGDTWRLETTLLSADDDCDDPGEAWDDNPAIDCDDNNAATYPGAADLPNDGVDQDCDGDDLGTSCYVNADGDAWRTNTVIPSADEDCDDPGEAPATVSAVDCDDSDETVYPGATEIPNDGVDQDCLDGDLGRACFVDADDDGWRVAATVLSVDEDCDDPGEADDQDPGPDCDDTNAQIYPGATDLPGDGIDQDCQGGDAALLCYTDADGDGWRIDALVGSADADCDDPGEADDQDPALDCDDTDPNTYPGATEIPGDRADNDCDGGIECYVDIDGDSWRIDAVIGSIDGDCDDDGEATDEDPALDCDDADADVYPGATEVPGTGIDADCDGEELCYVNADGDAWRLTTTVVSDDPDCDDPGEAYEIDPAEDCDDTNADIYPGATDVPGDQIDQDCNGDDATMDCAVDADGDGWRTAATIASADFDCDDPGEAPMDAPAEDCDDSDPLVYPGAAELIDDGADQDCDTEELCFVDADGDVWRTDAVVTSVDLDCDDPGEAHEDTPSVDCDDTNATVNPGAEEIAADGIDQDCDGEELCLVDADEDGLRLDDGATLTSDDGDCEDPGEATEDVPPLDCDDSSADADADGLSDADEVLSLQTDACDPDSDDDELTDGEEVNEHNTDPLLPDTDEGGVPDGEEVTRGSEPAGRARRRPAPPLVPGPLRLRHRRARRLHGRRPPRARRPAPPPGADHACPLYRRR
jgi:hypothetical protein